MSAATNLRKMLPRAAVPISTGEPGKALRTLEKSLPISLLRAREAVMAHFRPQLLEYDLSEQQSDKSTASTA